MVEFAIATTVFSMFLLGILEFGYAAWARNSVAADAREGARYAMVRSSSASGHVATIDSVSNYVKSKTNLDASIVVSTTWVPNNNRGSEVQVKVKHVVARRGPFIPAHTDSSTSKMVIMY
jgi:Flp pilus assembly protein TadG